MEFSPYKILKLNDLLKLNYPDRSDFIRVKILYAH